MEQDQTSKDNMKDAMLLQDQKDEKSLCQFWKMRQKDEHVPCPVPPCLPHLKRKLLPINQAMIGRLPKRRKINTLSGSSLRMTSKPAADIKVNLSKKKTGFLTNKSVHFGGPGYLARMTGWRTKQRSVSISQCSDTLSGSECGYGHQDEGDEQEEGTEGEEEKEGGSSN